MVYLFRTRATKLTMNKEFVRSITIRNTCFERSGILFWSCGGRAQQARFLFSKKQPGVLRDLPVVVGVVPTPSGSHDRAESDGRSAIGGNRNQ
jgi:hypothetical protein